MKIATQMGNQGHSLDDARTAVEYIRAGAIGDVREVHIGPTGRSATGRRACRVPNR